MGGLSLHLTLVVSTLVVHFLQPSAASFGLDSFRLINPHVSLALNDSRIFNITADVAGYNQTIYFILEKNDDLVPRDISVRYLNSEGHVKDVYGSVHRGVQYVRGSVWMGRTPEKSEEVGWARLVMERNVANLFFSGTFTIMQNQYQVEPEFVDDGSAWMVSSKHEQEYGFDNRCATSPEGHLLKRQSWNQWGDSNLTASIGNTYGCPSTRQIAYVGIMTDCSFTASFDSSDSAHQYILNMVNTASVVFESSFNISLGVLNLTISDADCPTSSEMTAWNAPCSQGDLNTRLQAFSRWRSSIEDTNAYWTLLTGCSVAVGEIGVSWMGALCNSGAGYSNGATSANVVARTQSGWQVFAHESGHMFGAVHDCTADTCLSDTSQCCPLSSNTCDAGGQYIMNSVSEQSMTRFSPCTVETVCSRLGSGQVDSGCLVELQTGNTQRCGNCIVESGESCDCGNGDCSEQESRCCDPITCQYREVDGCNRRSNTGDNGYDNGSGSPGNDPPSWTQRHLPVIIGASSAVGGALLLLLFGCLLYSCRRVRGTKVVNAE